MLKTYNQAESGPTGLGNLRRLAYFVSVVETGSFTAAAERLGITKAVVSQQVARLERELRTSLLVRTTRKVQPTELGQAFYLRCALILRDAEHAFDDLAETSAEPSGMLRLTAPFDYGVGVVVPAIAAFIQRYPACKVDAILSDQTLDLMSGRIELAIRVGWLARTSLQARKIGSFRQLLVASATMQSEVARLTRPKDIAKLPFVANTALRDHLRWNFSLSESERQVVTVQASIFLDATLAVREAVCQGAGCLCSRILQLQTILPPAASFRSCRYGVYLRAASMRFSRRRAFVRQRSARSSICWQTASSNAQLPRSSQTSGIEVIRLKSVGSRDGQNRRDHVCNKSDQKSV